MFRAIPRSSSEGQIVLLQHLVLSLSVSSYSVHRLRAVRSQPVHRIGTQLFLPNHLSPFKCIVAYNLEFALPKI